ncbi:hypothetical protein APR41_04945 [Salegentibacter salinarum]|uniref:Uncharacterized protein n=1 Tax=Salegentibacter salinarum TaxID=447422 RepID=A0A2N0TS41_9FLAO|nr:hypothetical protein [Salegentibacter salinarum]PKD17559.1 hypothetical protein APR41_04945 [Salegentibacter salinarum]SKB48624.1 hypothetical protein SAMN05660903_01013 [Salegentibacter salinarum]
MAKQVDFKKFELLDWLKDLEDENVLNEIRLLRTGTRNSTLTRNGRMVLTVEEVKALSKKRKSEWWGKKK